MSGVGSLATGFSPFTTLGASHWNCLVRANPHLSTLYQPLFLTGLTVLVLLLSLVGVPVHLLPFHFLELLLYSIPSSLFSGSPSNCLAMNLIASQSTK